MSSIKNYILWKIHNAGLINQLMSIEIGSSIAFLENKHIIFSNYSSQHYNNIYMPISKTTSKEELKQFYDPNIFQLINIPKSCFFDLNENVVFDNFETHENIIGSYYKCNDGDNENFFSESRKQIKLDKNKNNYFNGINLAFYSRFFFNRPKALDLFLSELKFKNEYINLAEKISNQLKDFVSIHFRLTDHSKKYPSNKENRIKYFNNIKEKNKNIVFCTDDVETIKSEFKDKCSFIDEIILFDFKSDFLNLEFHNNIVLGLISLLTMSYSDYFIGTPGSTFSSYIHRLRYLKNKENCFLYMDSFYNNNYINSGPYSWNGFDCHTETKNWWMEWPECKLNI